MMRYAGLAQPKEGVWGFSGTAIQGKLFSTDARILYVQPNNVEAVDLGNTGEDPTVPFATIQAALARCRPYRGDTILVGANDAWTYGGGTTWTTPIQESVAVAVAGVTIMGISAGLGVYITPAAAGQFCFTVLATDVCIDGFAFMGGAGGGNGIYAEWAGGGGVWWADNLVVRNCYFDDQIDIAIQLEYIWNYRIENCKFEECDAYGIYVDPLGSGCAYGAVAGNVFHDCAAAMSMRGGDKNEIYKNSILNSAAQAGAPATDQGLDLTNGLENQVFDNYFSCLLPVAAPGDYNDLNTAGAGDAWINNHCMNGEAITNPA